MKLKINMLISLICLSAAFGQAEFQICSIPENSYQLSNHRGLSALNIDNSLNESHVNLSIIYFPSNINYLNIHYNKYSFSILDYGRMTDQIDNNIINTFSAYEMNLSYNYKKVFKNILLQLRGGVAYSQLSTYNSTAIIADIGFSSINYTRFAISLNNIGLIVNDYTSSAQILPSEIQLGFVKNINGTETVWGYDMLYHYNIKKPEHILCLKVPFSNSLNLRISWTNLRDSMLTDTIFTDWFYGLGTGLEIKKNSVVADIGISSLGPAGLVYGMSFYYLTN